MVLEHLFLAWLVSHLASSFCRVQSAYRKLPSTETARLKVVNGMFEAVDLERTTNLFTLDLFTAFDTIDLMNRRERSFGVTGQELNWARLYMIDRISFIKVSSA